MALADSLHVVELTYDRWVQEAQLSIMIRLERRVNYQRRNSMTLLCKCRLNVAEERKVLCLFIKPKTLALLPILKLKRHHSHLLAEQLGLRDDRNQVDVDALEERADAAALVLLEGIEVGRVIVRVLRPSFLPRGPSFQDEVRSQVGLLELCLLDLLPELDEVMHDFFEDGFAFKSENVGQIWKRLEVADVASGVQLYLECLFRLRAAGLQLAFPNFKKTYSY